MLMQYAVLAHAYSIIVVTVRLVCKQHYTQFIMLPMYEVQLGQTKLTYF